MTLTSTELAPKLSTASIKKSWDVYTAFEWPDTMPEDFGEQMRVSELNLIVDYLTKLEP